MVDYSVAVAVAVAVAALALVMAWNGTVQIHARAPRFGGL